MIRRRCHLHVWQAVDDVKRDDKAIIGDDALASTTDNGPIMDLVLVVFNLTGSMQSPIESMVGVLAEDDNDGTFLRDDASSCVDHLEVQSSDGCQCQ